MDPAVLVHVGVGASDLEKSVHFWRDLLGLRVASTQHECVDLTDGFHNFRLFQHDRSPRPPHVGGLIGYVHLGVRVHDLAGVVERFRANGVEIEWDQVDQPRAHDPNQPLAGSFKISDPDGIVIDVTASGDQWPGVADALNTPAPAF